MTLLEFIQQDPLLAFCIAGAVLALFIGAIARG